MYRAPKIKSPDEALASIELICARMERAISDVRRSLYRWGITSTDDQDAIVAKLIGNGFVNEQRYAAAYVRDKLISGRWGVAKIRAGLRAKGLADDLITEAIEQNVDSRQIARKLEANMRKQYERERDKAPSTYALRVKLFRRAASQGFDFDTINDIINDIIDE